MFITQSNSGSRSFLNHFWLAALLQDAVAVRDWAEALVTTRGTVLAEPVLSLPVVELLDGTVEGVPIVQALALWDRLAFPGALLGIVLAFPELRSAPLFCHS